MATSAGSTPSLATHSTTSPGQGCAQAGVTCQGGLILGDGASALASAPALSARSYQALAVQTTTLSGVLAEFGLPASKAALSNFIGADALSGLTASGESCAYYLDRGDRSGQAFQLCFNSAYRLAQKAIISTSGSVTATKAPKSAAPNSANG